MKWSNTKSGTGIPAYQVFLAVPPYSGVTQSISSNMYSDSRSIQAD
ncbi:hypothetical protein L3C95_15040 [Chitinophaga filiformis]|nr:hypothetical protein [Chitinophaga filiformis]